MIVWITLVYLGYLVISWTWDFLRIKHVKSTEVVLITGGCQGLGREIAMVYAKKKCAVVIWDIAEHLFLEISAEIKAKGGDPYVFKCDVSQKESIQINAKLTLEKVGKVDIVINNAGIFNNYDFESLDDEKLEKIFQVNFFAYVRVTKAFYASAKHFVVIASILSKMATENAADYCATKHALDAFFSGVRMEAKRAAKPQKFTIVYPFHINSQLFEGFSPIFPFYTLNTKKVADSVYKAICLGKEELFIPFYSWHVYWILSVLPSKMRDLMYLMITKGSLDKVKKS